MGQNAVWERVKSSALSNLLHYWPCLHEINWSLKEKTTINGFQNNITIIGYNSETNDLDQVTIIDNDADI